MITVSELQDQVGLDAYDRSVLEVRGVGLAFGGISALSDVTFSIGPGTICGLIGPNGAGKTSLFNCVSRFYEPTAGEIRFRGIDLLSVRADEIASLGIARTFQHVGLFPGLTVLENVVSGAYHRTQAGFLASVLGLPSVRREERRELTNAAELIDLLGLGDVARKEATGLPYGTLKRIELARVLMSEPTLLLLDEPANGLIHEEVAELAATVERVARDRDLSVLLVEHHMGMVMSICDQVVVLNLGRPIADGTPKEVQANPAVIGAYLGGEM